MGDFSTSKGRVDSGNGNLRSPKESGTPKTGFQESPGGECAGKGPGPGVGNSRPGIR